MYGEAPKKIGESGIGRAGGIGGSVDGAAAARGAIWMGGSREGGGAG